jgi:hypothetical protein
MTRDDLSHPGNFELVDDGARFHSHTRIIARAAPIG